ncbi:MAG: 23S rRNA (adenine(2503)-C2)-methyltransferase, partial [Anaerolineae bacterium]|nr:23S rRNA (adenine(2503)-C2)-methyltransferase [Anaerolineae bacterium]
MKKEQEKPLIFELGQEELAAMLKEWGEPKYRVKQIWQGLYQNLWGKSEEFSNLPEKLRNKLAENFSFSHLLPVSVIDSKDGKTRK